MDYKALSKEQARVLGSMIEKKFTTPMSYPMSINAIKVACNQKSNRDPVVEYSDDEVFDTLQDLQKLGYAMLDETEYSRTSKYAETLGKSLGLSKGELAILGELFNRGPQTAAELRLRCERMHRYREDRELESCLESLAARGMIRLLERQSGARESRWGHLFCGEPVLAAGKSANTTEAPTASAKSKPDLESRVAALESQLAEALERIADLEKQ